MNQKWKTLRMLINKMNTIIQYVGHWFFCWIGDPIFSPSRGYGYMDFGCLHCGKVHGHLIQKEKEFISLFNDEIYAPIRKYLEDLKNLFEGQLDDKKVS